MNSILKKLIIIMISVTAISQAQESISANLTDLQEKSELYHTSATKKTSIGAGLLVTGIASLSTAVVLLVTNDDIMACADTYSIDSDCNMVGYIGFAALDALGTAGIIGGIILLKFGKNSRNKAEQYDDDIARIQSEMTLYLVPSIDILNKGAGASLSLAF